MVADASRVCAGVITGAHGVRGLVKIKSFTEDPQNLVGYGPLTDESGSRTFAIEITGSAKGQLLAKVAGIADRNAADALRGTHLYVSRDALPEPEEEEYYIADLVGLRVEVASGETLGRVAAVRNYGAGDFLEIDAGSGGETLLPFTKATVPLVEIAAGRLIVEPPAEILVPPTPKQGAGEPRDGEPGED